MIADFWVLLESRSDAGAAMLAVVDDEFIAELQLQDADVALATLAVLRLEHRWGFVGRRDRGEEVVFASI